MVTSALPWRVAGSESCPLRSSRIALLLMGRAGGNSLVLGVKERFLWFLSAPTWTVV